MIRAAEAGAVARDRGKLLRALRVAVHSARQGGLSEVEIQDEVAAALWRHEFLTSGGVC